jgi:hypothetical protein
MYKIVRTNAEVDDLLNRASDAEMDGSRFPGMSYEQGLLYAIRWLIGEEDEDPLTE